MPGSLLDGSLHWGPEVSYLAGGLPEEVYEAQVTIAEPALMEPGWTLTNLFNQQLDHPPAAVMYDAEGHARWYHVGGPEPDDLGSVQVSMTPNGEVLIGPTGLVEASRVNMAGEVVWTGPQQPTTGIGQMHHHFELLPNGNYVGLLRQAEAGLEGDVMVEVTPNHEEVWRWSPFDHLTAEGDSDWTHANSITVDLRGDAVYYNSRNLSTLFKIRRSTGEILWRFGKEQDFAKDPAAWYAWPMLQHAPEIQPNGNILFYDNGNDVYDIRPFTRVIEYAVDEGLQSVNIVWEFPGELDAAPDYYSTAWYSPVGGDADRLSNGNSLITVAMRTAEGQPSRLVEVQPDGTVVWEALSYMNEDYVIGHYRAERVMPPGLTFLR